jgi:arylsulfatase A-like enzyme
MIKITIKIIAFLLLPLSLYSAEKPNVLILFTDDQGTLDLNCYGATDLQTPNLDTLAEKGVRFTQAYAHTVCCPSRASLLTGRHPQRGGVVSWQQGDRHGSDSNLGNMAAEEVTIAEALNAAGYDTALFGKWHLGAKVGHGPLDQGFDKFWGHLSGFIDNYRHCFLHGEGYHDLYDNNQEIFRRDEYFPELLVEQALEYIEEDREDPFFMMLAFNLPHYPEQPIGKFANAYENLEMPRRSYARVMSTVDDQIVTVMDWFPTILELAQIEASGLRLDGRSMLPVIKRKGAPSAHKVLHFGWQGNWAVREGDWKLIGELDKTKGKTNYSLLNLAEKKPEVKNHAKAKPKIVARLVKLHEKLEKELNAN